MKDNSSIELTEAQAAFANRQVAGGRYASVGEVVGEGLRLLEARELKQAALRRALEAGEASGDAQPFSMSEFIARQKPTDG